MGLGLDSAGVSDAVIVRFEVSPPDLIHAGTQERYRILQNTENSLIAAISISAEPRGGSRPRGRLRP